MAQGYDNNYYGDSYSKDPTDDKKYECRTGPFEGFFTSSVEFCLSKTSPNLPSSPSPINTKLPLVNTFNCIDNNNINTNEVDVISSSGAQQQQRQQQDGSIQGLNGIVERLGQIDLNKNIVNLCIINNDNNNDNEPEPGTGSLKVNKEIYGCDKIFREGTLMDCDGLGVSSDDWIQCTDPPIRDTVFCTALPANFFDIEVLDDQNHQIAQIEGSAEGETIENLEPSTYTVNEIIRTAGDGQLVEGEGVQQFCMRLGFAGGGVLHSSQADVSYEICFEYEDEQGNDCRTITLAAEEQRTCTVKNYISSGSDRTPPTARPTTGATTTINNG